MTSEKHHKDLQLSASTLQALNEFLSERDAQEKFFEDLRAKEDEDAKRTVSIDAFAEDWQQSQFWYDDATAEALAEELLGDAAEDTNVAIVSAPSVFVKIQQMKADGRLPEYINPYLFEYDQRFAIFDRFVPYDYQQPLKLPPDLKQKFDRVLIDPPFMSSDCQTKAALTVRWLTKPWKSATTSDRPQCGVDRLILCTAERVGDLVGRLYRGAGLRETGFEIRHRKGLGNEYRCYTSFESSRLRFVDVGAAEQGDR